MFGLSSRWYAFAMVFKLSLYLLMSDVSLCLVLPLGLPVFCEEIMASEISLLPDLVSVELHPFDGNGMDGISG